MGNHNAEAGFCKFFAKIKNPPNRVFDGVCAFLDLRFKIEKFLIFGIIS
jgi:3',5'-cyclic AMP phosphodiesterase CpdA